MGEPETRKLIDPRVEIDTSAPFGSVKEAVTRFGGSGSWIPLHVLRLAAGDFGGEFDMEKMEKMAAELEKDLIMKEKETMEVLKELETAKGIVEGLKLNLVKEVSAFVTSFGFNSDPGTPPPNDKSPKGGVDFYPVPSPVSILTDLKEAKVNLNKTTDDLAMIRASVESLNKKMKTHKNAIEKGNARQMVMASNAKVEGETKRVIEESVDVSRHPQEFNFEAQQFRRMEEAAQYEVIKATSEIEWTKTSIKMVEMRLVAAKKMEEAARAMEAVALAETNGECCSSMPQSITLSYKEYSELTRKAQKCEELSKKKGGIGNNLYHMGTSEHAKCSERTLEDALGHTADVATRRNICAEGYFQERSVHGRMRFPTYDNYLRNRHRHHSRGVTRRLFGPLDVGDESNSSNDNPMPVLRSSVSIGDILSRKLILEDDIVACNGAASATERQREVSLSQMLREQSGLILHDPRKAEKDGRACKQLFTQRKKFGFIHVSLPLTKQSKKKTPQPMNTKCP